MKLVTQIREKFKETLKIAGVESIKYVIGLLFPMVIIFVAWLFPTIRRILEREITTQLFWLLLLTSAGIAGGSIILYACLFRKIKRLELEAATDPFLDVFNSRECERRLKQSAKEALRYGTLFSVCLIDVDGLKAANDRYNYSVGDRLLREFVILVRKTFRDTDIVFRYKQGDEFLVLVTQTGAANARVPAERLRQAVENYRFQANKKGATFGVTVSIGIAGFDRENKDFNTVQLVKQEAEAALSSAKKTKNCVIVVPFQSS